ncbi:hypothetical protein ACHAP7_009990 [Fusarium lateritium]
MTSHSIRSFKHAFCRWIRRRAHRKPSLRPSNNLREKTEDPQAWIVGILPLIAFGNLVWHDGSEAVEKVKAANSELSSFVETDQWAAFNRFVLVIEFLNKKDPGHQSQAHKALAECDPEFKKIEMVGNVFIGLDDVKPLQEWDDLDHLHKWIQANAVPRLSLVPTEIAEEAADVFLNTNYIDCWAALRYRIKMLDNIRAVRYRESALPRGVAFETRPIPTK